MDIKVRDAIKAIKRESFIKDQNVEHIEIESLNVMKLDDILGSKFVDVKYSEFFRKPLERKLQVEYSYADGERIAQTKEDVDGIVTYIRLNKFEAFETMANPKEKVINWKNANCISLDYQKLMLKKYGDAYMYELVGYYNDQIVKRVNIISQINDAFNKGFETLTLKLGKQRHTYTIAQETLLKQYSEQLKKEVKRLRSDLNEIKRFAETDQKEMGEEKID